MDASDSPQLDPDPAETEEWREAFAALVAREGPQRARFLLDELAVLARRHQIGWQPDLNPPYFNSIPANEQPVL